MMPQYTLSLMEKIKTHFNSSYQLDNYNAYDKFNLDNYDVAEMAGTMYQVKNVISNKIITDKFLDNTDIEYLTHTVTGAVEDIIEISMHYELLTEWCLLSLLNKLERLEIDSLPTEQYEIAHNAHNFRLSIYLLFQSTLNNQIQL